jgi:hypothetical protein
MEVEWSASQPAALPPWKSYPCRHTDWAIQNSPLFLKICFSLSSKVLPLDLLALYYWINRLPHWYTPRQSSSSSSTYCFQSPSHTVWREKHILLKQTMSNSDLVNSSSVVLGVGWDWRESTWYFGDYLAIVPARDDKWWLWSSRWNENWQGKPK